MNQLQLDPKKTALVVIDLQKGVVARECAPYSSDQVIENSSRLVQAFRSQGAFVVLVRVSFEDPREMLSPNADIMVTVNLEDRPKDWAEIVPEIGPVEGDYVLTKRQWGAFHGTELDLQLRRRGIETLVLCGIATGFGVDTTAREAYQHGYQQVFPIDAMSGLLATEHDYVRTYIFPRIGKVRTTEEVLHAFHE